MNKEHKYGFEHTRGGHCIGTPSTSITRNCSSMFCRMVLFRKIAMSSFLFLGSTPKRQTHRRLLTSGEKFRKPKIIATSRTCVSFGTYPSYSMSVQSLQIIKYRVLKFKFGISSNSEITAISLRYKKYRCLNALTAVFVS